MELQKIETLIEKGQYEEALDRCQTLLKEEPQEEVDILRTRAYAYSRSGDYVNAFQDRISVVSSGRGEARDYFLGATDALNVGQFTKASDWLQEVLRLGEEQSSTWFKSASYFYLAYAQMELENYDEAIANLDKAVKVESDIGMPIPEVGMCSHEQLRAEIERRKAYAKS